MVTAPDAPGSPISPFAPAGPVSPELHPASAITNTNAATVTKDPSIRFIGFEEFEGINGRRLNGEVFDRDTLIKAGIERADAFAACTSGDNSNVVSARIARERYNVPTVVARIYDPARAIIYRELGIRTISSVDWTCEQFLGLITHPEARSEYRFGDGSVRMMEIDAPAEFIGRRLVEIEVPNDLRVAAFVRGGTASLPGPSYVVELGDRLFVNVSEAGQSHLDQLICTT